MSDDETVTTKSDLGARVSGEEHGYCTSELRVVLRVLA